MRLTTMSRISSGSDDNPVLGRHEMIEEVTMAFEMGPPVAAGFGMPSPMPKKQISDKSLVMSLKVEKGGGAGGDIREGRGKGRGASEIKRDEMKGLQTSIRP
jgi:hypothetical protein